jgi:hypothetical protein
MWPERPPAARGRSVYHRVRLNSNRSTEADSRDVGSDEASPTDQGQVADRQTATHAPAPRVQVSEEVRSVVLAAEVDDDRTPPRGTAPPSVDPSSTPSRELEPYSRSNETTQRVDVKRRSGAARRWGRTRPETLLVVLGAIAALLLLAIAGWMSVDTGGPSGAPSASGSTRAVQSRAPREVDSADPPVDLADLPVEHDAAR